MPKSVIIEKPGGPEVFKVVEKEIPKPGKGEVLVAHTAIGINFIDIYHRSGLYPLPSYPTVIGVEAVGKIEAIGEGVPVNFREGERVAYCTAPPGTYCEKRIVPAEVLVKIPDIITDSQAAAIMVKGLTAYYLLHRTFKVDKTTTMLVHAAAGGVGQVLCQWAKHLGAKVIGTVSTKEKIEIAKSMGCDHVINYKQEEFATKVKEITGGQGVNVVYDSVGKDTFEGSLESLAPLGMLVSYGQASGKIPLIDPSIFQKKSLFFTRPSLFTYVGTPEQLQIAANELFRQIKSNVIKVQVSHEYALKDAAKAHKDLEARKTTGASILKIS